MDEYYWRLLRLAKPFRLMLGTVVILSLLSQAVGYLPMLALKRLMDAMQEWHSASTSDANSLYEIAAAVMVAWVVSGLFGVLSESISERLQGRIAHRLGVDSAAHVLRLPLGFHTRNDTAKKMNAMGRGTVNAHNSIWMALTGILPTGLRLLIYVGSACLIDHYGGVLIAVGFAVSIATVKRRLNRHLPIRRSIENEEEGVSSFQDDSLHNIRLVKASAFEEPVLSELVRRQSRILDLEERFSDRAHRSRAFHAVWVHAIAGAVLLVEAWRFVRGEATIGTVGIMVSTASQALGSTESLVKNASMLENRFRPSVEKLFALLDTKPDVVPPANPVPLGRMHGSVSFENVSFAYPDTAGTIHDVSFYVPAGTTVAVVGASGAGKSTLMTLLLRGYDPHAGRIRIDGKDLRDLDPAEYLAQVGVVLQGQRAFNMTVRDNIAFGLENPTDAQVEAAARKADAHEFILRLKDGYDTNVGESGMRLSGGQDQRLTIARALVRDPRLLILDEPTSNLDLEAESKVTAVLSEVVGKLKGTRTVFIIAHRLSTIRHADLVLVLDEGRIAQFGPYADLASQPGQFRRWLDLSRAQMMIGIDA